MGRQLDYLLRSILSPIGEFSQARWQPSADVHQCAHGWLVKFELAGVRPQDIDVLVCGEMLVVRGRRRDVRADQTQQSYRLEISYNEFERSLEFPCDLEQMRIATDYRDGMLLVRLETKEDDDESL